MAQKQEFINDIYTIGTYITERCRAFLSVPPPDPCESCPQCRLPSEQDVMPWLQGIYRPAVPYPTREAGR